MDNREIDKIEKQKIIEDMIAVWEDESIESVEIILEYATAIGDKNLIDSVSELLGCLEELDTKKDEVTEIIWNYMEELEEEN